MPPVAKSICITLLVLATVHVAALAADLIGQASVIDGDTLEIHGTRIASEKSSGPGFKLKSLMRE